ncbi:vitellogenin B1, partial [Reticulomyxa filosa]
KKKKKKKKKKDEDNPRINIRTRANNTSSLSSSSSSVAAAAAVSASAPASASDAPASSSSSNTSDLSTNPAVNSEQQMKSDEEYARHLSEEFKKEDQERERQQRLRQHQRQSSSRSSHGTAHHGSTSRDNQASGTVSNPNQTLSDSFGNENSATSSRGIPAFEFFGNVLFSSYVLKEDNIYAHIDMYIYICIY